MYTLQELEIQYLIYCKSQKRLDEKTLKAYRIDLKQFTNYISSTTDIAIINSELLEKYVCKLHEAYKPKTVKRKLASLKAWFHYLEYKNLIDINPFNKIRLQFRESTTLPKTIPLNTLEQLLCLLYAQRKTAKTVYQNRKILLDITVTELLFSTGMRISELCDLKVSNVSLSDGTILVYGKGGKERRIQIGSSAVIAILKEYRQEFSFATCDYFFVNTTGCPLSDQCVRRMLKKYVALAGIDLHITPHMFRHTFATSLLDADVDIRYIQEMLGHSSIKITEIYTHVAVEKQRSILEAKHPRKDFCI